MANFNKSFNFRGGFQVDESTFIVRGGTVGIGSTIPKSRLDVDGTITAKGLDISSEAAVGIESATVGFLDATLIHVGVASISAGIITATSPSGIVTYYGDARFLQGLPTSQWLDIDVGLGYTSIYAAGNVGVDTTDPRYPFQVGGVPFPTTTGPSLPAQDGVGIDRGDIYASGIVSTRGEFIGLGSNITAIDGSNITVGAIGSMAYGPLIVTEEVIADKFTGIASTAISVTPDATLEFDTATANEFTAIDRFFTSTGKIQVGDNSISSAVGDIDVLKTGSNSSVYSLSDRVSKLFVGAQRQSGQARQFGGLRRGLVGSDPLTQINDLDLVNYDIGNLNFYLHSGSGGSGITTGAFRWIYGQTDVSLAELSKEGVFSLNGNGVPGSIVLEVAGISSFSDAVYIDGDLTVPAGNTVNIDADFNVTGNFDISGSTVTFPNQVTLQDLLVDNELVVGNILGDFVSITGTEITSGLTTVTSNNIRTPILFTDTLESGTTNSNSISFTNTLSSAGFVVNSTGDITASSIIVNDGTINNTLNVTNIDVDTLTATSEITTSTINATGGQFDTITSTSVADFESLTVQNSSTFSSIVSTGIIASQTSVDSPAITTQQLIQSTLAGIVLNGVINGAGASSGIQNMGFLRSTEVSTTEIYIDGIKVELIFNANVNPTTIRLNFIAPTITGPNGYYAELAIQPS